MNNKKLIYIGIGIFVGGMIFGVLGAKFLYSKRAVLKKALDKLEEKRVERIPRKKKGVMIVDFEKKKDLIAWQMSSVTIDRVKDHATSGKYSAKLTFAPAQDPGVRLSNYLNKNKKLKDWEGYDAFALDLYNEQDYTMPVHLKIKDSKGKTYSEKIFLEPKRKTDIVIGISQLRGRLHPGKIEQISLFLWKNNSPKTVYIDNVRLIPDRFTGKQELVITAKKFLPKKKDRIYKGKEFFEFDRAKWQSGDGIVFPLYANNPTLATINQFPVSGGVPFPKGEVKSLDQLQVLDRNHLPLPFQSRILGYWPDRSIKWAQIDIQFDLTANNRQMAYVKYTRASNKTKHETHLKVHEKNRGVEVTTGPIKFAVKGKGFRLFDEMWIDRNGDAKFSKDELISSNSDMVIVHNNEEYRSSNDRDVKITVEEKGSLKTTIKAEGWFISKKKKKFCKFIVRMQAFANKDFVRVYHTFIYTGYPENKFHYLYKGKKLPKNETIQAITIETPYHVDGQTMYSFGADEKSLKSELSKNIELYQKSSDSFIAKVGKDEVLSGKKLEGWINLSDSAKGFSVTIKDLWKQHPKGWKIDAKRKVLYTMIWPKWHDELDLKTTEGAGGDEAAARGSAFGLGKTHELAFYFHNKEFNKEEGWNTVRAFEKTILLSAHPEWIYSTSVIGKVVPLRAKGFGPVEETMDGMFDWANRHVGANKWYGMIDFGDTLSWHRSGGWHPDGRWGWMNNEAMGLSTGSLMMFLRTGMFKYFELGENNVRHIMDVDTVHYNTVANDRRLKNVISDDYSQVGSQHRHNANHWGGRNEETSHTNLHGILLYYYMTGYERALDVAKEIGEFFLKERLTYFKHPDICPQRNISNVVWGTIEMYELTGDKRYKAVADKWADVLYRGQKYDGTWSEEYNPVSRRWNQKLKPLFITDYTLPALIAYHQVTGNKAIAESITKSTAYFMEHGIYEPYFEALVYSYYLTGDLRFLFHAHKRLDYYVQRQVKSNDPLQKGMIYNKAYYARPVEFLYQLPHALEALNEDFKLPGKVTLK